MQAKSAIVLCADDGSTLFAKNADSRCLIASTTKLMTALVCLEHASLDESVTATERHCAVEGSSMYLKAGERCTVRELLLGLLLASGNDAALALAEHVGGSEKAFVRLMNEKAAELGMNKSSFANPHGLDDPGHYSTARDLARLMLACMENADFRTLCGTKTAEIHGRHFLNHNRLLGACPGVCAGKTGYTLAAGRCLVTACERDGLRFVCVTLSDPDDWRDHEALYAWACDRFRLLELGELVDLEVPVISGSRERVRLEPDGPQRLLLDREAALTVEAELPNFVFAPVKKGETAGQIRVIIDGATRAEIPLVYAEDAVQAVPVLENRQQEA